MSSQHGSQCPQSGWSKREVSFLDHPASLVVHSFHSVLLVSLWEETMQGYDARREMSLGHVGGDPQDWVRSLHAAPAVPSLAPHLPKSSATFPLAGGTTSLQLQHPSVFCLHLLYLLLPLPRLLLPRTRASWSTSSKAT